MRKTKMKIFIRIGLIIEIIVMIVSFYMGKRIVFANMILLIVCSILQLITCKKIEEIDKFIS